jgi:hypothetical protein
MTMKNVVFWDVAPCGSRKNGNFGGTYCLHLQGENNLLAKSTLAVTIICSALQKN